jgi:hypothetical protein
VTASITPLIAGNWKMNGLAASLGEVGGWRTDRGRRRAALHGLHLPAGHAARRR